MKKLQDAAKAALEEFAAEYETKNTDFAEHNFSSEFEDKMKLVIKNANKRRLFIGRNKKIFASFVAAAAMLALTVTAGSIKQGGINNFLKYGFGTQAEISESVSDVSDDLYEFKSSGKVDEECDTVSASYDSKVKKMVTWEYELLDSDKSSVKITGYQGNVKHLKIPKKIDGYEVTLIDSEAISHNKKLKTVTISDTVTTLKESALYDCKNLEKVTVPNSVENIGEKAIGYYYDEDLDEDLLLDNITISCGKYSAAYYYSADNMIAFQTDEVDKMPRWEYTESGKKVVITAYNREEADVEIPDQIGGKAVEGIAQGAFANNSFVVNVTVPKSVDYIKGGAFTGCTKLKSVHILNKALSLEDTSFAYSSDSGKCVFNDEFEIFGYQTSTAYEYANRFGLLFKAVDRKEATSSTSENVSSAPSQTSSQTSSHLPSHTSSNYTNTTSTANNYKSNTVDSEY